MRNRTPKLLAFALAAVMTMGMTVSAAAIPDNPPEGPVNQILDGETMENNNGTVTTNNGTVKNNYGIVENNFRIVENNYGTVKNVGDGRVGNNFGGDVEGERGVDAQYYELPVPQNFSYEGAKKSDDRWWINFPEPVTIKADDDYYFESASISEGLGTITVADDHKSCTLSNVTGSLANGGLTLDVQEGEYTPEQPEPEPEPEPTPTPDPMPTTPPADNTAATEPASAPTVQQMEQRERPDPQDVEAAERYNFWMDVKADLRAAADGKTLRVHVPADYINMPASVMEVIRLQDEDIVVDLRWSGEQLIITPATAQRKTALKAFWTFEQLCELYAQ